MNHEEFVLYKKAVLNLGVYYGKTFEDHVIEMYAQDLLDLTIEELTIAIKKIKSNPKITQFPLPAMIKSQIRQLTSPEDIGLEASEEIMKAIGKFGWCNWKDAQKKLSPLALDIIERRGGWVKLCEEANETDYGIFRAQLRELAHSRARKMEYEKNELNEISKISTEDNARLENLNNILRNMPT